MKEPTENADHLALHVQEMIDAGADVHYASIAYEQAETVAQTMLDRLPSVVDLLDAVASANATHRDLLFTLAERVIEQERVIDRLVRRIEALEADRATH